MAIFQQQSCNFPDEDYLVFEVNPDSSQLSYSLQFQPLRRSIEFEFKLSSAFHFKDIIPAPAEELFRDGKILPLQPNQAQTNNKSIDGQFEDLLPASLSTLRSNTTTPSQSCRDAPFQSRRQRKNLEVEEFFVDYDISNVIIIESFSQKSLYPNFKRSCFSQKLKASREYLKSLFRKKPVSFSETFTKAAGHFQSNKIRKLKDRPTQNIFNGPRRIPCGSIQKERNSMSCRLTNIKKAREICRDSRSDSRRSLSAATSWLSRSKRSTVTPFYSSGYSSSSSSPSYFQERNETALLKSKSIFISEPENFIAEAIIHCKQSQKL